MRTQEHARARNGRPAPDRPSRRGPAPAWLLVLLLLPTGGCEQRAAELHADQPGLAASLRLLLPTAIEIQHYLTRPMDYAGTGNPDGLEVILAARDRFGDPVKCLGSFQFELYTRRKASADPFGKQLALWRVQIDSDEALAEYWHRYSRYYRFPLRLESGKLAPGRYILAARLVLPTGEKLYDDYEFTCPGP